VVPLLQPPLSDSRWMTVSVSGPPRPLRYPGPLHIVTRVIHSWAALVVSDGVWKSEHSPNIPADESKHEHGTVGDRADTDLGHRTYSWSTSC